MIRARKRNRLIITFDRNYGNETANYKKELQAVPDEGGEDFLTTRCSDTTTTTTAAAATAAATAGTTTMPDA